MALILNLETSTKSCSVALGQATNILAFREESSEQYIHSEKLHVFIEEVLKEAKVGFNDLEAIAVGMGPGSYTGLRIGVSAAKGLCYALSIPLISENGLSTLVQEFLDKEKIGKNDLILPMLDARRMEVYCARYHSDGQRQKPIEALVVESHSFLDEQAGKIHLIGDGAEKCKTVLTDQRFIFHDLKYPSAKFLNGTAQDLFDKREFRDTAYFEPFYLKDFVAGKPKKLL